MSCLLKKGKKQNTISFSVDGRYYYYNAWHILHGYKQQKENTIRDYLHVVYHCLFHHPFVNILIHQGCWDLACDIAAENAINDLGMSFLTNQRQSRQHNSIIDLKKSLNLMTAEKIYRYYMDKNLTDGQIERLREEFYADNHAFWYKPPEYEPDWGDEDEETGIDNPNRIDQKLAVLWKQISERAQVDIETSSRKWSDQKGGLQQSLNQVNREKYNYASFLKRFSVLGEEMLINDDEFDLIFYTYGLSLYKNMPLIEPLEYKDVKRVREFVIAIDTSGSVQGKMVQTFLQKTYNMLKQTENFFTKVNIHIIQCDAVIQEDAKITNIDEFERYLKTMRLRGFAGTDFRPVFSYVDRLIENKEFENLKGLIYFTDGYGTFPTKKPFYDTAFVFLDDMYIKIPVVPPWAIKLVLSSEDVEN